MDIAKILSDLGKMAGEIQKPMTLEDAINIIEPDPKVQIELREQNKIPDSMAAFNAMSMKAHMMVVEYARKKLEEECGYDIIEKVERELDKM